MTETKGIDLANELTTPCIEWQKYRNADGYGQVWHKGKKRLAHRLAYCQAHGLDIDDIDGQVVRHRCDNPGCVNPDHLEIGTHADNVHDKVERGRAPKGEEHRNAKLTEEVVLDILAKCVPGCREYGYSALARKYGVHRTLISQIVNREIWTHVSDDQAPAQ